MKWCSCVFDTWSKVRNLAFKVRELEAERPLNSEEIELRKFLEDLRDALDPTLD